VKLNTSIYIGLQINIFK